MFKYVPIGWNRKSMESFFVGFPNSTGIKFLPAKNGVVKCIISFGKKKLTYEKQLFIGHN